MFIELAEFLRCPAGHEREPYCVLMPVEMAGRSVVRGSVGCPVCQREYPIADGVAEFGPGEPTAVAGEPGGEALPDPQVIEALLGLEGAGGYVVLLGAAAALAPALAQRLAGVHFIGVNPPASLAPSPSASHVRHPTAVPLRSAMARGVVVVRHLARAPWLADAARVLLRGRRLVVQAEGVHIDGVTELATGQGLWVGERR